MKRSIQAIVMLSICIIICGMGVKVVKADELFDNNIVEINKEFNQDAVKNIMYDNMEISLLSSTGDEYEDNNGPTKATTGRLYTITYATIDNANDNDWYRVEIGDISHPYSFILTDIPNGCDYDMYLVTYDETNGLTMQYYDIKMGNTSEAFYLNFNQTGIYYIVVQPNKEYSDTNYSDESYKLYMGNYYKEGSFGYVDTGISANFGYLTNTNKTYKYSSVYSIDLSNISEIPLGATVQQIRLTADGNGAYWQNFYKIIASGDGKINSTQMGGIDVIYNGDSNVLVKQGWRIQGKILVSTYFVWQPKILFAYKYPIVLENSRFW